MRQQSASPYALSDMSNLITRETTGRESALYRGRILSTLSVCALATAVLVSLALVPAYIILQLVPAPDATQESLKKSADGSVLSKTQSLLAGIAPVMSTSSVAAMTGRALSEKPADVIVTSIAYTNDSKNKKSSLVLSGSAPRSSAVAYRDALIATKLFDTVSVPVAVLVGSESGSFSVLLTGSF